MTLAVSAHAAMNASCGTVRTLHQQEPATPSACMIRMQASSMCKAAHGRARPRIWTGVLMPRYLGPVGEGASAQVVLAQDELRRGSPPVVLKVMRRHLAAAGQKVLSGIPLLNMQPSCSM